MPHLTVVMLLIFGGSVLRDFSICLTVGIIIGTYSSVFVASALAYLWQTWRARHVAASNTALGNRRRGNREESKEATA